MKPDRALVKGGSIVKGTIFLSRMVCGIRGVGSRMPSRKVLKREREQSEVVHFETHDLGGKRF